MRAVSVCAVLVSVGDGRSVLCCLFRVLDHAGRIGALPVHAGSCKSVLVLCWSALNHAGLCLCFGGLCWCGLVHAVLWFHVLAARGLLQTSP
jgi:hypothetical protein